MGKGRFNLSEVYLAYIHHSLIVFSYITESNNRLIMGRSEAARELFLGGHNCTQSVVLAFADELSLSRELGLKMAAGFGAGMGRQQEICGAVTGAIMVLGLLKGEEVNNNDELKSQAYGSVKELTR